MLSNPPALPIRFTLRLEHSTWDTRSKSCLRQKTAGRHCKDHHTSDPAFLTAYVKQRRWGIHTYGSFLLTSHAFQPKRRVCKCNSALSTSKDCPSSLTAHVLPLQVRTAALSVISSIQCIKMAELSPFVLAVPRCCQAEARQDMIFSSLGITLRAPRKAGTWCCTCCSLLSFGKLT